MSPMDAIANAMRMLALTYANTPNDKAIPHLEASLRRIEPGIVEAVGTDNALIFLEIFRRGVMGHKHDIEAAAASGSLSQFLDALRC